MTIPRRRRRSAAPRVHSTVARPARNIGPGPPRLPSCNSGVFARSGPGVVAGSQPDSFTAPKAIFFAGVERGLFRRLAAAP